MNQRIFLRAIAFVLLVVHGEVYSNSSERIEKIKEFVTENSIPGITVGVLKPGNKKWIVGIGYSDIENKVVAKPETMYRIASVTKSITAVAVLKLSQQGKLKLHSPVKQYCPEFPKNADSITSWQLLLHTSGIRHYSDSERYSYTYYPRIVDTFKLFAKDDLVSRPGERFSYTSYGYNVLGCIVEGASGKEFLEYLKENIFLPADMPFTRRDSDQVIIPNRANGYERMEDGNFRNAGIYDTSRSLPGGGLISRVGDLISFGNALLTHKILDQNGMILSFTGSQTIPGSDVMITPGWVEVKSEGIKEIVSTGSNPKMSSILYILPEKEIIVSVICNLSEVNLIPLARILAQI